MKYIYLKGDTEKEGGDHFSSHSIHQNFASSDRSSHESIILVYGKTNELRNLIVKLLNEHEEDKQRKHEIRMHYTNLADESFKMRREHPWLVGPEVQI